MNLSLLLESFDSGPTERLEPGIVQPPAGYDEGYQAGLAAAELAFVELQSGLTQDFVQSVQETALNYQETQTHIIAAISPLLESMLATLLPAVLSPALYAHLSDLVQEAAAQDLSDPIVLSVPSAHFATVEAMFADKANVQLQVNEDSTLTGHAAWVVTPKEETSLDLDAALRAIEGHVASLLTMELTPNNQKVS